MSQRMLSIPMTTDHFANIPVSGSLVDSDRRISELAVGARAPSSAKPPCTRRFCPKYRCPVRTPSPDGVSSVLSRVRFDYLSRYGSKGTTTAQEFNPFWRTVRRSVPARRWISQKVPIPDDDQDLDSRPEY